MDVDKPDEKSIMTYVAQFLKHHPDRQETVIGRQQEEVRHYNSSNNQTSTSSPFTICLMVRCLCSLLCSLNNHYQRSVLFVESHLSALHFLTLNISLYSPPSVLSTNVLLFTCIPFLSQVLSCSSSH